MSVLANRPFIKMSGLGNEIVVVDMRRQTGTIDAVDARAAARPDGAPYDQLMALYAPRTPGTDAYVRIYNNDGSEAGACGNGMRCVAELLFKETGKSALTLETTAGLLSCWKGDRRMERDPACQEVRGYPHHRIVHRAVRGADPPFAFRGQHG